jgi:hypothetical protein
MTLFAFAHYLLYHTQRHFAMKKYHERRVTL